MVKDTGTYAVSSNVFDLYVMVAFGVVGYFFQRYGFPVAPVVLGLILGPKLETHLRRALIISRGDWSIFLQRPITDFLLAAVLVYLALPAIVWASKRAARGPSGLWTVRAEATPR